MALLNKNGAQDLRATGNIGKLINAVHDQTKGCTFYLPSKLEIEMYDDYFKESDEWVRKNFFPEYDYLWSELVSHRAKDVETLATDDLLELISKSMIALLK